MIAARLSMMQDMKPMLSMDDMLPEKQHLRDITKDTDARFFIGIPKGNQVAKASCCIVGGQGCGKSKLLEWRVAKAYKKYGEENVHVIYTDDIRVALDLINDQPVQYIIIDDAMTYASSRQVFQQTEIVKTYNKLVEGKEKVKNQWAQIDVQLRRRFDLIPNLVETVKGCTILYTYTSCCK